ncbi:class II SORL domain-containing protein [[Eubacterium] cellulosolvens]
MGERITRRKYLKYLGGAAALAIAGGAGYSAYHLYAPKEELHTITEIPKKTAEGGEMMKPFGDLIYTPDSAEGEALGKVESHTPKIEAPDSVSGGKPFEVRITVGPHPNTVEHSIRQIDVFVAEDGRAFNPIFLTTVRLTPVYSEPDIKVNLKLNKSSTLYAIEYCNLHGLWESRKKIEVA